MTSASDTVFALLLVQRSRNRRKRGPRAERVETLEGGKAGVGHVGSGLCSLEEKEVVYLGLDMLTR